MELGELLYNKSEYIETVRMWRACPRWQLRAPLEDQTVYPLVPATLAPAPSVPSLDDVETLRVSSDCYLVSAWMN